MKSKLITWSITSLLIAGSAVSLIVLRSEPAVVPQVIGLSYDSARELILREGWSPQQIQDRYGESADVHTGNGRIFWVRGYWELDGASGVGLAPCRFHFTDPEERLLIVITEGEESEAGDYHAKVAAAYIEH